MKSLLLSTALLASLTLAPSISWCADSHAGQAPAPKDIEQRTMERRAVEAVIWGMPAVNFQLMLDAFEKAQGKSNQVAYWSRPLNWKDQTLTPNPDTIYFTPYYDTTNGPVVLEVPAAEEGASITGSVDDAWQNALEDVGPAGVDKGKGGKYLILPPGYKDKVPAGYIPMPSDTYRGFAILRSNLKSGSDADIEKAVAYGKRIKFYPYAADNKAGGHDTVFVDVYDKPFDATIPYDSRFFDALDRFVQAEPWLTRDKVMIDVLKSLGIEKGKPFNPSAETKKTLDAATLEAKAEIALNYERAFIPPFFDNTHWALPVKPDFVQGMGSFFADPNAYQIDSRAVAYSIAYFSAKHLGAGQFYLLSIKDAQGNRLAGGKNYRLHVPANVPVKLYWSVTAYDGDTHALIRNMRWASRGSNTPGLQTNADGSVDIYFGPAAPGGKESNWVPTDPARSFELLFRFYGPEKSFFDKVWTLPDLTPQA
jgi:hypothetical protein